MGRNKPRHKIKQNGMLTSRWCNHCNCLDCNTMFEPFPPTIAMNKFHKRFLNKLCRGCGHKTCTCKNKKGY